MTTATDNGLAQLAKQQAAKREDQNLLVLYGSLQAWEKTPPGPAKEALLQKIRLQTRDVGFSNAQTDALIKVIESAGEAGGKIVTTILTLAENRAKLQQGQQAEMAKAWFLANAKQGDAMTGIASLFRVVAAFAKAFGMDEFADTLHGLADEQTRDAKRHYIDTSKMITETGTDAVIKGASEALEEIVRQGIASKVGAVAQDARRTQDIDVTDTASAGGRASVLPLKGGDGTQTLNHQKLEENLRDISVAADVIGKIMKNVKTADKLIKRTAGEADDVVDSADDINVVQLELKDNLTSEQLAALGKKDGMSAFLPKGPIDQRASQGPK